MFLQQVVFGGFQQLLSLFTLNRLGLNGSGNSILFVFVGIVIVAVQGYFIGKWSRKFGEVWLIRFGLALLAVGLTLTAITPRQAAPWYDQKTVANELSGGRSLAGETPPTHQLQVSLPTDTNKGYLGLGWILISMIPVAIGGGVMQPSINSLITRSVSPAEIGGTLGISAALLSGANSIAPVVGGQIFQSLGSSAPFLIGAGIVALLFLFSLKSLNRKGIPQPI
jgi:MFS transporter, DHA1 family, tetracycline resistance protein